MESILKILARPVYNRYALLLRRVHDLEVSIDTLILHPVWENDQNIFNGQLQRIKIFQEIIMNFDIAEVVETGTFIGNTTGYFAKMLPKIRILTCELSPRFYGLAKMRLKQFDNVHISCMDSRTFLSQIEVNFDISDYPSFFYLDAHWNSDLPLLEELIIIKKKRPNAIIMIDDFQVPYDPGYAFDNYGAGKKLSIENFGIAFKENDFQPFFPVATSKDDTGYRRGCVILAPVGPISEMMSKLKTLKRI